MKRVLPIAIAVMMVLGGCMSTPSPFLTTPETASIVEGNTQFGLDLYAVAADEAETNANIFISPASISTALGMTYGGARGETAVQMADALHFSLPAESFHPNMGRVLADVQRDEDGRTLAINNRIFVDQDLVVTSDFSALMRGAYNAPLQDVNFRENAEGARQTINTWVEDKTENRIVELLMPGVVHACTRMALVNTIYLDANWATPFTANKTVDGTFTTGAGTEITLPLMAQLGTFRHLETGSFQALELPYQGDDLSMIIFLPKRADGLLGFEARLTPNRMTNWSNRLLASDPVRVDVKLPKMELRQSLKLKPSLEALGMRVPFSSEADFQAIAAPEDNRGDPCQDPMQLTIDEVVHQTFLKVDEEGTEAAAATAVFPVVVTSARTYENPPIPFHADHPFFFVIRDNVTGLVLFMGRFVG